MEEINHSDSIPYLLILDELEGRLSSDGMHKLEEWKSASALHFKEYQYIIHLTDDLEVPGVGKPYGSVGEIADKDHPAVRYKWILVSVLVIILIILGYAG